MELSGKVFKVMPVESGEGKNGTWKKQQVVIETDSSGKYPKKVCVVFWSDLVNSDSFIDGKDISIEFDIESREYNGKWYTDVKAWKINSSAAASNNNSSASNNSKPLVNENAAPAHNLSDVPNEQIDDDLPF